MSTASSDTGIVRDPASAQRAFAVWSVAFALGLLYHEWQAGPEVVSVHAAAGIAALLLLLRPTSTRRLLALFVLIIVELAVNLPEPLNHDILLAVGAVGALLDWLWLRARRTPVVSGPAFFFERVAPMLRVAFIVMWCAAALSKLNRGFLSPDTSCALWIIDSIPLLHASAFPRPARGAIVAATVLLEMSIPVLLLLRRTRLAGIALGWLFHLTAAFAGHTAFSGIGWSMYLLFLPAGTLAAMADVGVDRWRQIAAATRDRAERWWRHPASAVVLIGLWLLAVVALQQLPEVWLNRARRYGAMLPYVALAPVWALLVWHGLQRRVASGDDDGDAAPLRLRHPIAFVVVLLVVVNALSPYVGLKTRYSFTMYSNLRTEAGLWNHLVVPESVRVATLQDDVIRVTRVDNVDGDDAVAAIIGEPVPSAEARRLLASHPDATARYERDGEAHVADPVSSDPVVGTPLPPGAGRLLGFRTIAPTGVCQH